MSSSDSSVSDQLSKSRHCVRLSNQLCVYFCLWVKTCNERQESERRERDSDKSDKPDKLFCWRHKKHEKREQREEERQKETKKMKTDEFPCHIPDNEDMMLVCWMLIELTFPPRKAEPCEWCSHCLSVIIRFLWLLQHCLIFVEHHCVSVCRCVWDIYVLGLRSVNTQ